MLRNLAKVVRADLFKAKYLKKTYRCEYGKIANTGEAANDNGTNCVR